MLGDLPLEILRHICSYLSPEATLSFAHSCQHTYQVCDDWNVWRNIVKGSAHVRNKLPAPVSVPAPDQGSGGKKHTMTDAEFGQSGAELHKRTDIDRYLPQLLVLGYTMTAPLDLQNMYCQFQALVSRQEYPSSLVRAKADCSRWFEFLTDPKSRFDSKEWLSARTASLCFAVGALSDSGYAYQSEEPFARLEDVQWFNSTADQRDCSESLTMQHSLAYAAVGSFCLELRAALDGERTIGEDFEGTSNLPSISNIPLASQTWKTSSPSYPSATVRPEFFTDHVWTGYISTRGDWRSVYHGIGGHNLRDLPSSEILNRVCSADVSVAVDSTVRFHVVNTLTTGDFVLRSNYFHTRDSMYTLVLLVEQQTGRLSVCMSRTGEPATKPLQTNLKNAITTPFGIVYGIEPGSWLWLWKSDWCAGAKRAG